MKYSRLTLEWYRMLHVSLYSGFDSAKGQLIRSIIFPRPNPFTFYRDSFRFVAVMGGIGTD